MKIIPANQPTDAYYLKTDRTRAVMRRRVILWAVNEITLLAVGLVVDEAGVVVRADSIEDFHGYGPAQEG